MPVERHAAHARLTQQVHAAEACQLCSAHLPHGCRPVMQLSVAAPILLVGQAPGARVHASGRPFTDPSGNRLRSWLQMNEATFYDPQKLAILPSGLCFPGTSPKGGDFPPRPECAPLWHPRLRPLLQGVRLTLLVGSYAQAFYLKEQRQKTLTETVAHWHNYLPQGFLPLPHPSWRNTGWLKKNPWFEMDLLPVLRNQVHRLLKEN